MSTSDVSNKSKTVAALREGVGVVQMVFFKELKVHLGTAYPEMDQSSLSMLAGAIINELFGTHNQEERFVLFREQHTSLIETEMSSLHLNFSHLLPYLTDALRVQTLCDNHEGFDNTSVLEGADRLGVLLKERDIPLPSAFMTYVRGLGEQHQLIIPPIQITAEDDSAMIH